MARVLIADDDPEYLAAFTNVMESLGHLCKCVTSGDAALASLRSEEFDILFLDVIMPGRGAISTLHAVRKTHRNLPVIIISGKSAVFESPIIANGLQLAQAKMPKMTSIVEIGTVIETFAGSGKMAHKSPSG